MLNIHTSDTGVNTHTDTSNLNDDISNIKELLHRHQTQDVNTHTIKRLKITY